MFSLTPGHNSIHRHTFLSSSFSKNRAEHRNTLSFKGILSNENLYQNLFNYSLFLLPVGLVFGEVPTSIAEIIVFLLWLFTNKWQHKFSLLVHSNYFWVLSAIYFIHIVGLLYTSDFNYAFNDLRVKLPLFIFPIILFSTDFIDHKHLLQLLKWTSIIVFVNLLYLWINLKFNASSFIDTRSASVFISHIRLGLISAFSVILSIYLVINHITSTIQKIIFVTISGIVFILMLSLGLITGIITLFITTIFAIIYMIIKSPTKIYFHIIFFITILSILSFLFYFKHVYSKYFPEIKTPVMYSHTVNNNSYTHDIAAKYTENGHLVLINISDKELKREWEKRSPLPYAGTDKKGNELKYTLYRYLTSKGLTKDSAGMAQLNDKDIQNIECGYPNYLYARANYLEKRIYELLQEYQYFQITKDPNGKTIIMRLLYWKIATSIWLSNFWIGVGTGDVQKAYDKEYQKYPKIQKNAQLRAHHQIITFAVTFGIPGLIIILINIFYPLFNLRYSEDYMLYYLFSIITLLSFFVDDSLETQPGVTFYAMFNTLLIKFCMLKRNTLT